MSSGASGLVFRLHALAAGEGDCFLVEYGNEQEVHRVVIDGGTSSTFPRLARLLDLHPDRPLELLVVTHIDADHIAGVLPLSRHSAFGRFKDIWFNGFDHLMTESELEPLGVRQGELLTSALKGRPWNLAFGGGAVRLDDDDRPVKVVLAGGANVTILSPSATHLSALRNVWESEICRAGLVPSESIPDEPTPAGLERLGAPSIDVDALASTSFAPDTAAANGSSIAFFFEFAGRRVLFGADAFAGVLVNSVQALGESESSPVDVFKLPHHGSHRNVSTALVRAVPASTYLITTNGDRHSHPDAAAIARIIKGSRAPHLAFNYRTAQTRIWEEIPVGRRKYPYTTQYGCDQNGLVLDLLQQ